MINGDGADVKSRQHTESWIQGHESSLIMNSPVKREVAQILKRALMLPLTERAALAKSLVASLAPSAEADGADFRASSDVGDLYDQARDRALARLREGIDLQWTPAHSRAELHRQ
jgi:hypothetical protein